MPEINFNLLAPSAELYSGPQVQMDPVAAYEKAKATRQSNMLAQLYAKHYDPQTGGVNYNALIPEAAQSGLDVSQLMPGVREQQESMASIAQKRALQQQEEATAAAKQQEMFKSNVDTAMKWSRSQLDSIKTPDEYLKWHEANHTNPYLAEFFKQNNISKEDRRSEINSLLSQEGGLQKLIDMSKQGLDNYLGVKPEKVTETEFDKKWNLFKKQYPNGTYEQFVKLSQAPGTSVTVKTGEDASVALAKQMGQKVADEMADLNTKATSAVSNIKTSQLLLPLVNDPKFISGTLGDARLAVAKALGLSGAEATQTFFAGIGKQVAENVKSFGSGTAISDADRAYAEKIAGGSIELTPSAIKKIMDLNDKYSQMAIDKYNSRKKFLSQKNPTINDYYEDITSPSKPAAGGGAQTTPTATGGWGKATVVSGGK